MFVVTLLRAERATSMSEPEVISKRLYAMEHPTTKRFVVFWRTTDKRMRVYDCPSRDAYNGYGGHKNKVAASEIIYSIHRLDDARKKWRIYAERGFAETDPSPSKPQRIK